MSAKWGILAALIMVTVPVFIGAQNNPLSPEARNLKDALSELQKTPDDASAQERCLKAFPRDYKSFLALLVLNRELYDGHEFIVVLSALGEKHEAEVGRLVVQLSKDAQWDADAPNFLKHETVAYGDQHTQTFASLLKQLQIAERAKLIIFLAHAENFAAYPEFQQLIDHLKTLGQNDIAKEFEAARAAREKLNSR